MASTNLGVARYDAARAQVFRDQALDRVRHLPGVTAAAWTNLVPTAGSRSMTVAIEGYRPAEGEDLHFYNTSVTAQYFQAIGTRLMTGRAFDAAETAASPPSPSSTKPRPGGSSPAGIRSRAG